MNFLTGKPNLLKRQAWIIAGLAFLSLVVLLFSYRSSYHVKLPLKLNRAGLPCIHITIQGKSYPTLIDAGSRFELDMYEDILEPISKYPYKIEHWKNFKGDSFQAPTYLIPKMTLGSLVLKKTEVVAFPSQRSGESTIWSSQPNKKLPPDHTGTLGQGFLRRTNMLLDVQQSIVIFSNQHKKLKKDGYDLATFTKVPMDITDKGTFISVLTDLGVLKLFLDTGCTWTILHKDLYPLHIEPTIPYHGLPTLTSKNFTMNGTNFGEQTLCFLDMPKENNNYDGLLGMDFFETHTVYMDFPNHTLYIKPISNK